MHRFWRIFYIYFNSLQFRETQDTTNQVRQSAEKLSNRIKQARDELEEDLKETRDVVKELKDFLSGKDCLTAEDGWTSGLMFTFWIDSPEGRTAVVGAVASQTEGTGFTPAGSCGLLCEFALEVLTS